MKDSNPVATLCSAFGPTLMVLGVSAISGTIADVLIAVLGALSTSYALLINGIHRSYMRFGVDPEDNQDT
tara:strand:- start:681 stop:890 length:210 start_codon:yes stop_codon:yes gene_type:complete